MGRQGSVEGIEQGAATLVQSEAPAIRGRGGEPTMIAFSAIEGLKVDIPHGEAPRIDWSVSQDIPSLESPSIDPHDADRARPPAANAPSERPRRLSPFAVMAASLAAAAAAGAMLGAIVVTGIARPTPVASGPKFGVEDVNALKEQVVQARVELAALKIEPRCRPSRRQSAVHPHLRARRAHGAHPGRAGRQAHQGGRVARARAPRRGRSRRRDRVDCAGADHSPSRACSKAGSSATSIAAPLSSRAAWASSKSTRAT